MADQIIYVPSEAQRAAMADAAIKRHDALPAQPAPDGAYLCCGVEPELRLGGGVLGSLRCPKCGTSQGAWTMNIPFVLTCWNRRDGALGGWHKPDYAQKLTQIKGFDRGIRWMPQIHFSGWEVSQYCHRTEDRWRNDHTNSADFSGVVMRYSIKERWFEFFGAPGQSCRFEFHHAKTTAGISCSVPTENSYIHDAPEVLEAPLHSAIQFWSRSFKWARAMEPAIQFLSGVA